METSLEGEGTLDRFVSVQMGRFRAKRRDPPCLPLIYRNFTSNWLARVSTESSKRTCRSARLIICSRLFLARPESSNLCLVSTRERVRVTRTAPVALSVVTVTTRGRERERERKRDRLFDRELNENKSVDRLADPRGISGHVCKQPRRILSLLLREMREGREREREDEFRVVLFISRNNGRLYPVQDFPSRNT